MIINEWNNLIVTDNVLTNLPISLLSSIPAAVDGMGPADLLLISRPCDPPEMTETGYMSYKTDLGSLSAWMHSALDIPGISAELADLRISVDLLSEFYNMLCRIRDADPSVFVDIYDQYNKFNPYVISSIIQLSGVITDLRGYRFADAMANIFNWKKFNKICAITGYFDNLTATNGNITNLTSTNAKISNLTATRGVINNLTATNGVINNLTATNINTTNLTIGGQPFQHLSTMSQTAYNAATKKANYYYFTYPG